MKKHTYKAVETETKHAYYLNPDKTTQTSSYASGDGTGTITMNFTNKKQTGNITITKLDSETENPVKNAVYGLYAKEDIVHPDGHTGIVNKKDALVETFPGTNNSGTSTLSGLYLGKYYIKEISAPSGYVLSDEVYDVNIEYEGQNIEVTNHSKEVTDVVQRNEITIIKKDSETGTTSQGDASLQGATYGLYVKEDIIHADETTGIVKYDAVKDSIHEIKLNLLLHTQIIDL